MAGKITSWIWKASAVASIVAAIAGFAYFSIWWTFNAPPGSNFYLMLEINLLICILQVALPAMFLGKLFGLFTHESYAIAVSLALYIIAGALYAIDLFVNGAIPMFVPFILNLILFPPLLDQPKRE